MIYEPTTDETHVCFALQLFLDIFGHMAIFLGRRQRFICLFKQRPLDEAMLILSTSSQWDQQIRQASQQLDVFIASDHSLLWVKTVS